MFPRIRGAGLLAMGLLLASAGPVFATAISATGVKAIIDPKFDPAFDITWSGPYGSGSAVLTATLDSTGEYTVTSLTGTQDGMSITLVGVDGYGDNDNTIYRPPTYTNLVDFSGLSFTNGVQDFNIFLYTLPSQSNTYTECESTVATTCSGSNVDDGVALTALAITPATSTVPEPASAGLLAVGLLGLAGLIRQSRF